MDKISKITFGTWGLSEWGKYSLNYCKEICNEAYERGITSFDTSRVYGAGKAEQFLSSLPPECFIATKVPAKDRSQDIREAYSESWVEHCIEQSRQSMQRNTLDLVQLHNWSYDWDDYRHLIDLMECYKDKGIVKHWGVSLPFERKNLNEEVFDEPTLEYFQVHYNALEQQNKDLINELKQKGKTLLLKSVLLHGFLLDSVNPPFNNKYESKTQDLVKQKNEIFSNLGDQSRIEFCLEDAFSTGADSVVLGITKDAHLSDIAKFL